jgi:hypothetical protein
VEGFCEHGDETPEHLRSEEYHLDHYHWDNGLCTSSEILNNLFSSFGVPDNE